MERITHTFEDEAGNEIRITGDVTWFVLATFVDVIDSGRGLVFTHKVRPRRLWDGAQE